MAVAVQASVLPMGCAERGPCDPATEPAVRLTQFEDGHSGAQWAGVVRLTDVEIGGVRVTDLDALTRGPAFDIVAEGGHLRCTMPCGFGTRAGRYSFTVEVFGYRPARVEAAAEAGQGPAGCGAAISAEVRPVLEPPETPLERIEVVPLGDSTPAGRQSN